MKVDLTGSDLSNLVIWQADFSKTNLHHVNLTNSNLKNSNFPQRLTNILTVAFSNEGNILATGDSNGEICFWSLKENRLLKTYKGHAGWIFSLAFSPDGQNVLTGSSKGATKLWRVKTGKLVCIFVSLVNRDWISITSEGLFNASTNGAKYVNAYNVYDIMGNSINTYTNIVKNRNTLNPDDWSSQKEFDAFGKAVIEKIKYDSDIMHSSQGVVNGDIYNTQSVYDIARGKVILETSDRYKIFADDRKYLDDVRYTYNYFNKIDTKTSYAWDYENNSLVKLEEITEYDEYRRNIRGIRLKAINIRPISVLRSRLKILSWEERLNSIFLIYVPFITTGMIIL